MWYQNYKTKRNETELNAQRRRCRKKQDMRSDGAEMDANLVDEHRQHVSVPAGSLPAEENRHMMRRLAWKLFNRLEIEFFLREIFLASQSPTPKNSSISPNKHRVECKRRGKSQMHTKGCDVVSFKLSDIF